MSSRSIITRIHTSIPTRTQAPIFVSVKALRPCRRNVRVHSKRQLSQIESSLLRFGWTYALLADEEGNVICGNGRLTAAQKLGLSKVPVIYLEGLSESEKRALALADNKIASNAGRDRKKLAEELGELAILLPEIELSLEDIGFETAEFDSLVANLGDSSSPPDTLPETDSEAISRAGDLWRLGRHFILCGDSGCEADVAALFGRQKASVVFADPPYNVRVSDVVGRGKRKHREFLSGSGELTSAQFVQFLTRSFQLCATYAVSNAVCFCCIDRRHMAEMLDAGKRAFSELLNLAAWVKNKPGQGSLYRSGHELIFIYRAGSAPHQNNFQLGKHGRNRSNVWDYPRVDTFRTGAQAELTLHPTVEPLALVADAIRRWQAFTKSDAILVKTGQTFDDLDTGATSRVRSVK